MKKTKKKDFHSKIRPEASDDEWTPDNQTKKQKRKRKRYSCSTSNSLTSLNPNPNFELTGFSPSAINYGGKRADENDISRLNECTRQEVLDAVDELVDVTDMSGKNDAQNQRRILMSLAALLVDFQSF